MKGEGIKHQLLKLFMPLFVLLTLCMVSQEKDLDQLMDLSLKELSQLKVVSAFKSPQTIENIAASVKIVTAAEINRRGYTTLEDALSDLPGFQFRNIQGFNSYVFLRGIPSQNNKILVLIDGITVNELNSGGFYGGAQYNLDNIDRIEVIYGPASALYGTNGISGIINLITRKPESNRKRIQFGAGSFSSYKASAALEMVSADRDMGITLSGMVNSSHKADLSGNAGDNNWTGDMENFERNSTFDIRFRKGKLQAGLSYQNKRASRTTNYKTIGDIYRDRGTLWNILFINSYARLDSTLAKQLQMSTHIYYRNSSVLRNTVAAINDQFQIGYYRPNHLFGFENMLNYRSRSRWEITWGIVGEWETLAEGFSKSYSDSPDNAPPRPEKPETVNNFLVSSYLQLQYKLSKQLQLSAGARLDSSSVYNQIITPRVAAIFSVKRFSVKLLYTEAFRAPKPWDYTDGVGNSDLKPEQMRSGELILSYRLTKRLKTELSLYSNRLDRLLTKASVGSEWQWINGGRLDTAGLEWSLEYRFPRFSAYANITLSRSRLDMEEMVPEIAAFTLNSGFNYGFSKRLSLNLRLNHTGKRETHRIVPATGTRAIEPAWVLHATLRHRISKGIVLRLMAKNLLDTEYYHPSNRPPERYRQAQRTLIGNISIEW